MQCRCERRETRKKSPHVSRDAKAKARARAHTHTLNRGPEVTAGFTDPA